MKTDREVQELFQAYQKCGAKGRAGMKAKMSRNTASKYINSGRLPSAEKRPRAWRTHEDVFAGVWDEVEQWLQDVPELEAKALFEHLSEERPEVFQEGQLRTFQRRVREWRALHGPEKEVFFGQEHRPGEALQWDFWEASELGVTIGGETFKHQLYHAVLPFSNWEHVTISHSESMLAIRAGLTRAVRSLQHVPQFVQSDNSSAATHRLPKGAEAGQRKRDFNVEYEDLVTHYGMTPRKIGVGKSVQNGDVESMHNGLRRRLIQRLKLRGSVDFESAATYQAWLDEVLNAANRMRQVRLREEIGVMRPLSATLVTEYMELAVPVLSTSTINVRRNIYSVPSRLIGEEVDVRLFEGAIEVYFKGQLQLQAERLPGNGRVRIDYRHVIHSLVRKPGAFARYRYRDELFPSLAFRKTYDAFLERLDPWHAAREYLLVLKLAADTMECQVQTALELLLADNQPFASAQVRELVAQHRPALPEMARLVVQLSDYDALLRSSEVVA